MNKKILFLITESDWGGAQKFLLEFIPFLAKNKPNFNISIAAGGQGVILETLQKQRIHITHLKNLTAQHFAPVQDMRAFFDIYALLKKENPEIVFCISTKAGFYGSLANFIFKLFHAKKPRVIYKIGGFAFTERIGWLRKTLYLWMEKITASFKDIIIVNSRNNYELALHRKICSVHKLRLIYNGIDIGNFTKQLLSEEKVRQQLNLPITNIVVGTVANFYKTKGLPILIDAVRLLQKEYPKIHNQLLYVIIGEGPERNALEKQIQQDGLEKNILLTGALPHARAYLNAFDIFVLPSVKEGFPWTILEAMAAGLPIIATSVGGVPEMIQDHKNGVLIPPGNPEALTRALLEILSDAAMRARYGEQAKIKSQEFSLDTMLRQYRGVIEEALR